MCMKEAAAGASMLAVNREAVSLAGQRKPSKRHISGQTHHLGGSSLSKRCFKPAFWLDPSRADRCSSVNALRSVFFA
ncbi:Bifunctional protein GlmU [Trichinella pseudospiralis]